MKQNLVFSNPDFIFVAFGKQANKLFAEKNVPVNKPNADAFQMILTDSMEMYHNDIMKHITNQAHTLVFDLDKNADIDKWANTLKYYTIIEGEEAVTLDGILAQLEIVFHIIGALRNYDYSNDIKPFYEMGHKIKGKLLDDTTLIDDLKRDFSEFKEVLLILRAEHASSIRGGEMSDNFRKICEAMNENDETCEIPFKWQIADYAKDPNIKPWAITSIPGCRKNALLGIF